MADSLIALRGYSATAPENTLAAIRAAIAVKDWSPQVWLEVRTTSDGVLVLLADETLDRTTSCQGPVVQLTAAELAACDAGSWFDRQFAGERVPRLVDALALPGVAFVLDLEVASPDAVMAAVQAAGVAGRVTVVTAREADVRALKALAPDLAVWWRVPELGAEAIDQAKELGAEGLAVDAVAVDEKGVRDAVAQGLAVAAVGVADERQLFELQARHVNALVTARLEPLLWAGRYRYRTYAAADFGLAPRAGQGFARALAVGRFDDGRAQPGIEGRDDLVIGAPFDSAVAPFAGWMGLVLGGMRFPGKVIGDLGQGSGAGVERDAQWGAVFAVGDYDADGYDDLAVGYPLRDFNGGDSGAVWLIDGSPTGRDGLSRPIGPSVDGGAQMGAALATGDFNGDGVADLAIGIPGQTVNRQAGAGQVVILPGLAGAGPIATGALVLDRAAMDVPGEPAAREGFGAALAAGDFDGDSRDDLAIGVTNGDAVSIRDAGSVVVVTCGTYAITNALRTVRVEEISRDTPDIPGEAVRGAGFGSVLAAGDFDNDGFDDLAIGSPGARVEGQANVGDVVVTYGLVTGRDKARSITLDQSLPTFPGEPDARNGFGSALAVGDLNGDRYPDLVVGSPGMAGDPLPGVGSAAVVYGGAGGVRPRVVLEIAPGMPPLGFEPNGRQAFGSALAVGDLNGDGASDLAVGSPGQTAGGVAEAGALVVAWGGSAPEPPGVATATVRPATLTPTPYPSRTPRPSTTPTPSRTPTIAPTIFTTATATPTRTPRGGGKRVYAPYVARLGSLGYFPTPRPGR